MKRGMTERGEGSDSDGAHHTLQVIADGERAFREGQAVRASSLEEALRLLRN